MPDVSEFNGRQNCNDFSIGIELEGTEHLPYTDAQYQSLVLVNQTTDARLSGYHNGTYCGTSADCAWSEDRSWPVI